MLPWGGGGDSATFSQQVKAVSRTGTFAPSCSLLLSSGFCFTDTVISKTALLSHSICPPSFRFSLLFSIHLSPSPSPRPPPQTDNRQQFQPVLCENLAQPFVSFSIHAMLLK